MLGIGPHSSYALFYIKWILYKRSWRQLSNGMWKFIYSTIVMAALWNRAGHYIFILWFLSSIFFFPRLILAVVDWMSTILPQMVLP